MTYATRCNMDEATGLWTITRSESSALKELNLEPAPSNSSKVSDNFYGERMSMRMGRTYSARFGKRHICTGAAIFDLIELWPSRLEEYGLDRDTYEGGFAVMTYDESLWSDGTGNWNPCCHALTSEHTNTYLQFVDTLLGAVPIDSYSARKLFRNTIETRLSRISKDTLLESDEVSYPYTMQPKKEIW